MTSKHTTIRGRELKEWLNEFADRVSDKEYEKFSYQTWREMTRVDDHDTILIDKITGYNQDGYSSDGCWEAPQIRFRVDGTHRIWNFDSDDGSFGEFFMNSYLRDDGQHIQGSACDCYTSASDYYTPYRFIEPDQKVLPRYGFTAVSSLEDKKADISISLNTKADKEELSRLEERLQELSKIVNNNNTTTNNEKENTIMKGFNFDFGPVNANVVRMSMYGLAVKNKTGTYVSYDAKNGEIMDVDIFNFDGAQFIWKMPVAIKDIAVGDVVVHQNIPMFVVAIPEGGKVLTAVDPVAGERKDIMLARSPFGFNFATKVVNLLGDMFNGAANADNPFGNMWMLMALGNENNKIGDGKGQMDFKSMLPMMLFAQGGSNMDPTLMMVMMAMTQEGTNVEATLPVVMWAIQNMTKPVATCNCDGNCGNH